MSAPQLRLVPPPARPKKIIAFPWQGGKFRHLNWLLPLLPECGHYVEPYGGSGSVLLNRKPSRVETLNDISGEIVNFFRVLREDPERLVAQLELTPWARDEFVAAFSDEGADDLERARRFFVRIRQGYHAAQSSRTQGCWSHGVLSEGKGGRLGRSETGVWANSVAGLRWVAERLLSVQIENKPALWVIERYDTPQTLFYVDPPYMPAVRTTGRCYDNEMSFPDWEALAKALDSCEGKVAVSTYDHPSLDDLFPFDRWLMSLGREFPVHGGATRQECLLTNYDPRGV